MTAAIITVYGTVTGDKTYKTQIGGSTYVPLSEGIERVTSLDDLALVCSNCHTMIHRGPELLSLDELRKLIR